MTHDEYIVLYEKCQVGKATPAEQKLLEQYHDDFELTDGDWNTLPIDKEVVKASIYGKLNNSMHEASLTKRGRTWYWIAAASVALLLTIGFVLFKNEPVNQNIAQGKTQKTKSIIMPGGNKATLTLADGSTVNLDSTSKGTVSKQGSAIVKKLANGQLAYNSPNVAPTGKILYNTATTPKGGQYELILSDGTKVWLNAASSLKFPVAFAGKERHVELTGEAYFEVAKNKNMPFSIAVKGSTIEVLGTHFNVNAYDDEKHMITTLLEGSVKLKKAGIEAMLKPGQQGVLTDGETDYKISEANTDGAVAWKNGYFVFDNENIQSIMKKLARWYDVDVTYKGAVTDQNFGGTVSRFANVSELLKMLELTGTIHFKTEGRMITVTP